MKTSAWRTDPRFFSREVAWHEGNISDEPWAPLFVRQAMGEALVEVMCARAPPGA